MKIAVIGSVVKDTVNIDGVSEVRMGGIVYYTSHVFKALGTDVEVFTSYSKKDEDWVKENFIGIKIHPTYTKETFESHLSYSKENPDTREMVFSNYDSSIIPTDPKLLKELEPFDYILFSPLFHDNISYEFFEKLQDKKFILGNFGIFNYPEKGHLVLKHPENLIRVASFLKYLFLDEKEIKFAAQKDTAEESAKYFLGLGVETVFVTMGSRGSVIFTKEKQYKIPAFPVEEVVDPTGAGDTYMAAFISATRLFDDIQKQGEFAAMAATMSVEKGGAFEGSVEDVLERLKNL